jgi:FixJ family two-component response regulator
MTASKPPSPQISFLDDNEDLRAVMISLIETRLQAHCLELQNFQDFLDKSDVVLGTQVIVLDIDLGFRQPTGLDAFLWLKKNNYQGKVFFLTGHGRTNPMVAQAEKMGAYIWEKPIGSAAMIQKMSEFIPARIKACEVGI